MRHPLAALVVALSLASVPAAADEPATRLLRQPSVSADALAFAWAGDLWVVPRAGGEARRLTTFPGVEANPCLSPDGRTVAFTAEYDGNVDLYTIPVEGGIPRRLTFHPMPDRARGWTPDGRSVLFATGRESPPAEAYRLWIVPAEGGPATPLPMPRAFDGAFSPDGRRIVYMQHPLAAADELHEKSLWRNYRGGRVHPLWIFDLKTHETVEIPWDRSNDSSPMWIGDTIYFLSDRDLAVNLHAYDVAKGSVRQVTRHRESDIATASAGGGHVVYSIEGDLHLLDPRSGSDTPLAIRAKGDLTWTRSHFAEVADQIQSAGLSPGGTRALLEARGEIFTVPSEKGDWRNLTRSSGAADRAPVWSPDGASIAWFSDAGGEYRLMIGDQKGEQPPRAIPLGSPSFYYAPAWSPDGSRLLFHDVRLNLMVVEVETGKLTRVDTDTFTHPERTLSAVWSPDSKWIAYARRLGSQMRAIMIWPVEGGRPRQVTDGLSDAVSPAFSRDGKYLWFLASTDTALNTGWLDMSSHERPSSRSVYLAVLSADEPSPLLPESGDEEPKPAEGAEESAEEAGEEEGEDAAGDDAPPEVKIDLDGLSRRIVALGLPSARYEALAAAPDGILYVSEVTTPASGPATPMNVLTLHRYDLKEREANPFLEGIHGWWLSHDGAKLLYRAAEQWGIVKTGEPSAVGDGAIDLEPLRAWIEPKEEWRQILREAWRLHRDYFYDSGLHGADWDKVLARHMALLPHVAHRSDLAYLIAMMAGELSVGHSFSVGGAEPEVEPVSTGLLGADLAADSGRWRIARILDGESWNPELQAPLAAPGVKVSVGDYLLEVNGVPLTASADPHSLFVGTAGRQTTLRINAKPSLEGSRLVTVVPVESDSALRMRAWVEENRREVDRLSGGRLAYVYLPDTGDDGYRWFNRYYFAQQDRQGVILDERYNGGGYAADYIIDILARRMHGYFNNPADPNRPYTVPMAGIFGPKVMIINESAGSGGDFMPWLFRRTGLGPLVGTRTWGGLVGIWDFPLLVDGGVVTIPRGGFFTLEGRWEVENEGVAPDIEVRQMPKQVIAGGDPQLERAVAEAMRLLEESPPPPRARPQPPSPKRALRPGDSGE